MALINPIPQTRLPVLEPDNTFKLYWIRWFQQILAGSIDPAVVAAIEAQIALLESELANVDNIANEALILAEEASSGISPTYGIEFAALDNDYGQWITPALPSKVVLGLDGQDGEDGQLGVPGTIGRDGFPGAVGGLGPPGLDGEDGVDGFGVPGAQGPAGTPGSAGATGPQGPPGPLGMPGFDGEDGADGYGIPGLQGPAGVAGAPGAAGQVGPPGIGLDGEDGQDGLMVPLNIPLASSTVSGLDRGDGTTISTVNGVSSVIGNPSQLVYQDGTVPGGNTVANIATETAFASTYAILANTLLVGSVIKITLFGVYSTALAAPNLTVKIKLGGTTVLTTGTISTLVGSDTNVGFAVTANLIVTAIGASGTLECQGLAEFDTTLTTGLLVNLTNTAAIGSINTTGALALTATVTWGTASASNTITLRQMLVEVENIGAVTPTVPSYSTGSWTPALTFGGGSTGLTYTNVGGYYVQVGKLITVSFSMQIANKGSSTGNAVISGLPFPAMNSGGSANKLQSTSVNYASGLGGGTGNWAAFIGIAGGVSNTSFTISKVIGGSWTAADFTSGTQLVSTFSYLTD